MGSSLSLSQASDLFGLQVKLPPAHLFTTHGGIFTLSMENPTRPAIELESSEFIVNALFTRPLIYFSTIDCSFKLLLKG